MSLISAIKEAQTATNHAKPFIKLMEALTNLDREIRAASSIQADADAAAQRKAQLESEIPALQAARNELQNAVASLQGQFGSERRAFENKLAETAKAADALLNAKHAQVEQEHQAKVTSLKNEITTLGGTVATLQQQKTDLEAQITQI